MERILILSLAFILFFSSPLFAERVRYVVDGDTIILSNNLRVRLLGLNAPEVPHKDTSGQFYGKEAKDFLQKLVKGKEVKLENDPYQEEYDRFGRRLAYIYLSDGTFVNEKLIKEGCAEVFRKYDFKYKNKFLDYEQEARQKKLGMWSPAPSDGQRSKAKEYWSKLWLDILKEVERILRRIRSG